MALELDEVLGYLNNYFVYTYAPHVFIDIESVAGASTITLADDSYEFTDYALDIRVNQYIRIVGTRLNDGVYKVSVVGDTSVTVDATLLDEESDEDLDYVTIYELNIPQKLLSLVTEMITWEASSSSPVTVGNIQSEKLGPHSITYAKTGSNNKPMTVFDTFNGRLKRWRKVGWQ